LVFGALGGALGYLISRPSPVVGTPPNVEKLVLDANG
jgi:hypothetical protein